MARERQLWVPVTLLLILACRGTDATLAAWQGSLAAPGSSVSSSGGLEFAAAYNHTVSVLNVVSVLSDVYVAWSELAPPSSVHGNGRSSAKSQDNQPADTTMNADSPLAAFVRAINDNHVDQALGWDAATQGNTIASLRLFAGFWPATTTSSVPVTVITSGSMDRLMQLRAQCKSWQGPLSAVLFQPILQEQPGPLTEANRALLRQMVVMTSQVFAEMQSTAGVCELSLSVVYELYTEASATALFPVNSLRNLARLQARTPVVAMLDVDLLPSASLYTRVSDPEKAAELVDTVQNTKTVFIIPTFDLTPVYETPSWAEALTSAPSKAIMQYGMDHDMVTQFHGARWPPGHSLTNFARWKTAKDDYTVQYEAKCEPWVLGSRTRMPWHDARYRGFGLNKIQHIHNLANEGFSFVVLHDAYTVHRPHKHAEAEKLFMTRPDKKKSKGSVTLGEAPGVKPAMTLREHARSLFAEQTKAVLGGSGRFKAAVGSQLLSARKDLPWWSRHGASGSRPQHTRRSVQAQRVSA